MGSIRVNVAELIAELPVSVTLVAAAKTRTPQEIIEAIEAGVKAIGMNYVQEAELAFEAVGRKARWHMIGHLQRNKAKTAVRIFDIIETVDSLRLAEEIDKHCKAIEKDMPVLIEINSGKEEQKTGVVPEKAEELIREIAALHRVHVAGLMTMGPRFGDPEDARPFFQATKRLFDELADMSIDDTRMQMLSMGMSNSYRVAIEEGATLVRIGTSLFGERVYD